MTHNKKRFSATVLALVLSVGALAAHARSLVKVTLAQNSFDPSAGVTMIARAKGFFAKEGLDVHVIDLTSGKLSLDAVVGRGADFGTVAETPLMHAGLAGQSAVILASTESSYSDVKLISRADRGIHSVADLKGKTIATAVGTNAEFFVTVLLKHAGLKPSEVKVINLRPQDMPAALARGDIDGYAIWEPFVYQGRKLLGKKATVLHSGDIYFNFFLIAAMRDYVQKNPDTVRRFLKALLDAERYIKANPADTTTTIAKAIGMDRASFAHIRHDFHYHVALQPRLLQTLEDEAKWAISNGKAPANADVAALKTMIAPAPLKALVPHAVTGY